MLLKLMSMIIPHWQHQFSSDHLKLSNVRLGYSFKWWPPGNSLCFRLQFLLGFKTTLAFSRIFLHLNLFLLMKLVSTAWPHWKPQLSSDHWSQTVLERVRTLLGDHLGILCVVDFFLLGILISINQALHTVQICGTFGSDFTLLPCSPN